jgi:hypothetical protein
MLFSSCILVTLKFAAGRKTCRPSRAELGLKDWAIMSPWSELGDKLVSLVTSGYCLFAKNIEKQILLFSGTRVLQSRLIILLLLRLALFTFQ